MKSLESIAKQMFLEFVYSRSGHHLDWRYLPHERKVEWIMDVYETFILCLEELKQELSIGKLPNPGAASYEKGFVAGEAHEARRLSERITGLEQKLSEQFEKFKEGKEG